MTLSSLIGSLTRRESEPPPAATAVPAAAEADLSALIGADALQFIPAAAAEDLGALHDVRDRIAELLPGVQFDDNGRGAFTRTGYALEFDTGRDERVAALQVRVSGGAAATPPLRRLMAKTGWQLAPLADAAAWDDQALG